MHRVIISAVPGQIVDHINRDTLDNRRGNLRIVTARQNVLNSRLLQAHNRSGYRGVCWQSDRRKWRATIHVNRRNIHLGWFHCPEEAARAYDFAAKQLHEGFSPLNFEEVQ